MASAILSLSFALHSCIKDEEPNKECDITSAWVEDEYKVFFYDDTQTRVELGSTDSEVTFTVRSLLSLPKQLRVSFDITPGATIEPASGSPQDFTSGPVTYTVTSQDGAWQRQYKVQFKEALLPMRELSFEDFETIQYNNLPMYYHNIVGRNADGTTDKPWASGNPGFVLSLVSKVLRGEKANPEDFPTMIAEDGYKGRCLKLVTMSTGDFGKTYNKPIAAGNLFMGHFLTDLMLRQPLQSTKMGVPFTAVPVRMTGYYKYRRGEVFTGGDGKIIEGRVDEPHIYGVLYRNKDEQGQAVQLDGGNVLTSPYVVRKAVVASLPPTEEWQRFEMFFEGDTPIDRAELSNLGYNLAIVFCASKGGDLFEGAIGSTLWVDEVQLSLEDN